MIVVRPRFIASIIKPLLKILIILGLIDLVATIYWISANLAVEANPIMNYFMGYSLEIFAIVKLIFMFSGIIILNYLKDKRSRLVFGVSFLLVFIYWIIGTWHLYGVMRLLL